MGILKQGNVFHNTRGLKGKIGGVSNRSFRSGYREPPKPTKKQLAKEERKRARKLAEQKAESEQPPKTEGPSLLERFLRLLSRGSKEGEE